MLDAQAGVPLRPYRSGRANFSLRAFKRLTEPADASIADAVSRDTDVAGTHGRGALRGLISLDARRLDAAEVTNAPQAVDDRRLALAEPLGLLDRGQRQDRAALLLIEAVIGQRLDQCGGNVDHVLNARFVDRHATAPGDRRELAAQSQRFRYASAERA
jgi:hypothetical protein